MIPDSVMREEVKYTRRYTERESVQWMIRCDTVCSNCTRCTCASKGTSMPYGTRVEMVYSRLKGISNVIMAGLNTGR